MKNSHRQQYIWIIRGNGRGVMGFTLEELNQRIDEWNNHPCPFLDFWDWMSLEYNENLKGFDYIWNHGNKLMSYVHIIKRKVIE